MAKKEEEFDVSTFPEDADMLLLRGRLEEEVEVEGVKILLQTLRHCDYLDIIKEMRGIPIEDQIDFIKVPTLARAIAKINGKVWREKLKLGESESLTGVVEKDLKEWDSVVINCVYDKFLDLSKRRDDEVRKLKNLSPSPVVDTAGKSVERSENAMTN